MVGAGAGMSGCWAETATAVAALSNDPLPAGNCCLGLFSSLCVFQEPAVVIKVVLNLEIP